MKRLLICVILLSCSCFAVVRTSNGTGGGNLGTGASWSLSVAPDCASDQIIVLPGDTITTAGANSGNCVIGTTTGLGLRVEGASGNPGKFVVSNGDTITFVGSNTTTAANMQIDQYGQFWPHPGAIIKMQCTAYNACAFVNNGSIDTTQFGTGSATNITTVQVASNVLTLTYASAPPYVTGQNIRVKSMTTANWLRLRTLFNITVSGNTVTANLGPEFWHANYGPTADTGETTLPVVWTVPAAQISWNNVNGVSTPTPSQSLISPASYTLATIKLGGGANAGSPWISNAAGTALGSCIPPEATNCYNQGSTTGNTSLLGSALTVNGCTPACQFTHEKADWTRIVAQGDYAIDYSRGLLWVVTSTQPTSASVGSYTYLSSFGGGITSTSNTNYNEGIFDNSLFLHWGGCSTVNCGSGATQGYGLTFSYKFSDTVPGSVHRRAEVTDSSFYYTYAPISFSNGNNSGKSGGGDDLLISRNYSNSYKNPAFGGGWLTVQSVATLSYATFDSNIWEWAEWPSGFNLNILVFNALSAQRINDHLTLTNNVDEGCGLLAGSWYITEFPNLNASGNMMQEYGNTGCASVENFSHITSTDNANRSSISNNFIAHPYKPANIGSFVDFTNNYITAPIHHGMLGGPGGIVAWSAGLNLQNNIFADGPTTNAFQFGYNGQVFTEGITWKNNTAVSSTQVVGTANFGDAQDAAAVNATIVTNTTNVVVANNIGYHNIAGYGAFAHGTTVVAACPSGCGIYTRYTTSPLVLDHNDEYSASTGIVCGVGQQNTNHNICDTKRLATFTLGSGEYNTLGSGSRNVTGIALRDPSYSTTQSGLSIAWTYTGTANAPSAITASLNGGTPSSLLDVSGGGSNTFSTASNPAINAIVGRYGFMTDGSQSWASILDENVASNNPTGGWIVVLDGAGAGQIRNILGACNVLTSTGYNCASIVSSGIHGLLVAPSWSIIPSSGDHYVIVRGQQLLTDGSGNTVMLTVNPYLGSAKDGSGGVPSWQTPTSNQTDTGIGLTFTSVTPSTLNPNFLNHAGTAATTLGTWQGGAPGSWTDTGACNLGTWNRDINSGDPSEEAAVWAIKGNPALTTSSLLPYLRGCYTPHLSTTAPGGNNCALSNTAYGGAYFGAVAPDTSGCALTVADPVCAPGTNTYNDVQSVTCTDATSGATMCYRTDGIAPSATTAGTCDAGSTTYSSAISIAPLPNPTNLQILATKASSTNSSTISYTYTFTVSPAVTFTPVAGTYVGTQSVALSTTAPGTVTIYWNNTGSPVCGVDTLYTSPISVPASISIYAVACRTNFNPSTVNTATYVITTAAPSFPFTTFTNPSTGTFGYNYSGTVTTCPWAGSVMDLVVLGPITLNPCTSGNTSTWINYISSVFPSNYNYPLVQAYDIASSVSAGDREKLALHVNRDNYNNAGRIWRDVFDADENYTSGNQNINTSQLVHGCWQLHSGTYTDVTAKIYNSTLAGGASPAFVAGDYLVCGYEYPFRKINFTFTTPASGATLVWQYSDGAGGWPTLSIASDGTSTFTTTGQVVITPPTGWRTETVNGVGYAKYWIRVQINGSGVQFATVRGDDWTANSSCTDCGALGGSWIANALHVVGDEITDSNGNIQRVTACGSPCTSGASAPTWSLTSTTTDSNVTWTTGGVNGGWLPSKGQTPADEIIDSNGNIQQVVSCQFSIGTSCTTGTTAPTWSTTTTPHSASLTYDNNVIWQIGGPKTGLKNASMRGFDYNSWVTNGSQLIDGMPYNPSPPSNATAEFLYQGRYQPSQSYIDYIWPNPDFYNSATGNNMMAEILTYATYGSNSYPCGQGTSFTCYKNINPLSKGVFFDNVGGPVTAVSTTNSSVPTASALTVAGNIDYHCGSPSYTFPTVPSGSGNCTTTGANSVYTEEGGGGPGSCTPPNCFGFWNAFFNTRSLIHTHFSPTPFLVTYNVAVGSPTSTGLSSDLYYQEFAPLAVATLGTIANAIPWQPYDDVLSTANTGSVVAAQCVDGTRWNLKDSNNHYHTSWSGSRAANLCWAQYLIAASWNATSTNLYSMYEWTTQSSAVYISQDEVSPYVNAPGTLTAPLAPDSSGNPVSFTISDDTGVIANAGGPHFYNGTFEFRVCPPTPDVCQNGDRFPAQFVSRVGVQGTYQTINPGASPVTTSVAPIVGYLGSGGTRSAYPTGSTIQYSGASVSLHNNPTVNDDNTWIWWTLHTPQMASNVGVPDRSSTFAGGNRMCTTGSPGQYCNTTYFTSLGPPTINGVQLTGANVTCVGHGSDVSHPECAGTPASCTSGTVHGDFWLRAFTGPTGQGAFAILRAGQATTQCSEDLDWASINIDPSSMLPSCAPNCQFYPQRVDGTYGPIINATNPLRLRASEAAVLINANAVVVPNITSGFTITGGGVIK